MRHEESGKYSMPKESKNPITIKYTSPKKDSNIKCDTCVVIALEEVDDNLVKAQILQEGMLKDEKLELLIHAVEDVLEVLKRQQMINFKDIFEEALKNGLFEKGD